MHLPERRGSRRLMLEALELVLPVRAELIRRLTKAQPIGGAWF